MERLQRTNRSHPCPICGEGNQKCAYNSTVAICVNKDSDRECKEGKSFIKAWIHRIDGSIAVQKRDQYPEHICQGRETLDKAYRAFLKMLILEPRHISMFLEQGVPLKMLIDNQYKTVPEFKKRWLYAKQLREMGLSLEGIPGFFQAEGKHGRFWTFAAQDGYFIPVKDMDGYIIRLRIRLDHPQIKENGKTEGKVKWFASPDRYNGTPSGIVCHVARGDDTLIEITEGEKKADIICYVTGHTCVSVPGVGTYRLAIPIIRKLMPMGIKTAYDMDKLTNPDVLAFERQLQQAIKEEFPTIVLTKAEWDIAQGKGADDFLIWKLRNGLVKLKKSS